MEGNLIAAFIIYVAAMFAVVHLRPSITKATERIFPNAADEWTEQVRKIEMSGMKHRSFSSKGHFSRSSVDDDFYYNDSTFDEDDFDFHHQQGAYAEVPEYDPVDGFDKY
ncbi:hypothetical protein [Planococcus salinus]|uniref:Uncharacterized protein n=1 Tax=Planococcus salinus TaxID=1848460 RepID=A0A3M8P4X8_9BACL|nr:hypothetical protein [Planococcus salinus]RNF38264.1 hypothetical protein EEX84_15495 [Planococcus salinus]